MQLLRQGISPAKLALSVALGCVMGVLPLLGVTTALCTVIAIPLRLNLVAIQAANWLVYPLQIALLVPFMRWGERLFRQTPLPLAPSELVAMVKADAWGSFQFLWATTLHALVVWSLLAIPATFLLHLILTRIFTLTIARRLQTDSISKGSPA
jgi:uncharacterized protein (DUF2062 family)